MYKTTARKQLRNSDYDLSADIEKIKNAFSDAAEDVKGRATEILSQSVDNALKTKAVLRGNMEDYVAEKPFKSLGLAMLSGLLLGLLIRRK